MYVHIYHRTGEILAERHRKPNPEEYGLFAVINGQSKLFVHSLENMTNSHTAVHREHDKLTHSYTAVHREHDKPTHSPIHSCV